MNEFVLSGFIFHVVLMDEIDFARKLFVLSVLFERTTLAHFNVTVHLNTSYVASRL